MEISPDLSKSATEYQKSDLEDGAPTQRSVFQLRVARYFHSYGWKLEIGKRVNGLEIDIYGVQKNILAGPSYLIVKCKENDQVTSADLIHLTRVVRNFDEMIRRSPTSEKSPVIKTVLAYSGGIDESARRASRGLGRQIRLMKF